MLKVTAEYRADALLRDLERRGLVVKLETFDAKRRARHWHRGFEGKPGVLERSSIERFVDHAMASRGRIDVMVNNAGVAFVAAIEDSDDERTAMVMDTNFYGPLRLIRAALPHFRARRHGHIINVCHP